MGWKDAVEAGESALTNRARHPDPYLELLRLGAQHTDDDIVVTLFVSGAIVTGTVITLDQWERILLRQLKKQSTSVRYAAGGAMEALDEEARKDRKPRPDEDSPFVHLRDVTYRCGREQFSLSSWRGPVTALSGWTLGNLT